MGRIALCYPDRFKGAGALVVAGTLSSPDMGRDAVVTAQPMDAFGAAFGDGSVPGMYLGGDGFDVGVDNRNIDWTDGSTTWTAAVGPNKTYTATEYVAAIVAAMNAAEGITTIAGGFSGSNHMWLQFPTARRLLGSTGSNSSTSIWNESGFGRTDTGLATVHTAPEARHSPHMMVGVDCGAAVTVDVVSAILYGDDECDFSDVKAYGGDLGFTALKTRHQFENSPTRWPTKLTLSPRGARDFNHLQGAIAASTKTHRYWALSWRDQGEARERYIGHFGAYPAVQSSSAHVRALRGHRPVDLAQPMGVERYYSQSLAKHWRCPLALEQWPVADYRTVFVGAVEADMSTAPGLVLVNYDDIKAGTVDWEDEADRGLALYATLVETPNGANWVGAGSVYIDAEFVFAQVR